MIIDHTNLEYVKRWISTKEHRFNGAYYYSTEIVHNIIPRVKTDRNWITVNCPGINTQHTIVFVHDNLDPANTYSWLSDSEDVVLVCGVKETMPKVAKFGTPIYLPLSIDTEYVKQFKTRKTKDVAYAGRPGKPGTNSLPKDIERISGRRREDLLSQIAKFRKIYAVGRTAVEAKALGCEILPFDDRFLDTSVWEVLDNRDAASILQVELDKIDGDGKNIVTPVDIEITRLYYDRALERTLKRGEIITVDPVRAAQLIKKLVAKQV